MVTLKNTDELFDEANEVKPNWFKFEKIGDTVKGIYVGSSHKDAQDIFPAQKIYELKTDTGITYVGFSVNKIYIHNAMKSAKIGQIVGFKYADDFQTDENKKKGLAPAKTIKVFLGPMDEDFLKEKNDEMVNIDNDPEFS